MEKVRLYTSQGVAFDLILEKTTGRGDEILGFHGTIMYDGDRRVLYVGKCKSKDLHELLRETMKRAEEGYIDRANPFDDWK